MPQEERFFSSKSSINLSKIAEEQLISLLRNQINLPKKEFPELYDRFSFLKRNQDSMLSGIERLEKNLSTNRYIFNLNSLGEMAILQNKLTDILSNLRSPFTKIGLQQHEKQQTDELGRRIDDVILWVMKINSELLGRSNKRTSQRPAPADENTAPTNLDQNTLKI